MKSFGQPRESRMEVSLSLSAFLVLVLATGVVITQEEPFSNDSSNKIYASDNDRCLDIIGKFVNGTFQGLEVQYDLKKLLEKYGGPPGKVNATWTEKEDAPVEEKDSDKRPLPEANRKYWLYKFGDTDLKTYARIEHAVRRFSGTLKNFTEIRGQLFFTPVDFCGKVRKADYTVDDRGFIFNVNPGQCVVNEKTIGCLSPERCTYDNEGKVECVRGESHTYDEYVSSYFDL